MLKLHPGISITADLSNHARVYGDQSLTTVTIRVADDGPGVPDWELEAIRRGDESPLSHVSGVGLWLVTWLTGPCDCDVHLETDDNGTTVSLEFQAASPEEQLTQQTPIGRVASVDG